MHNLRVLAVACFILGVCSFSSVSAQTDITVSFLTDCWGGESSWSITDPGGVELVSISSGTYGNQTTYDSLLTALPDGCYLFTVGDTYGDGLNGTAYGCAIDGDYSITDGSGNVLVQMPAADFGNGTTHYFTLPFGADLGCTDPEALNYDVCAGTDDGSCTYPPLTADFSFSAPSYCQGTTIQFTDLTIGNPDAWSWDFPGGTPSSSTDQNPAIQYLTDGTYSATLTASNAGDNSVVSYDVTIIVGNQLEIIIVQDNYPQETSWTLTDEFGVEVANGDVNGGTYCIGDNCHQFTIYDSYGDGICCGYGQGSFELVLNGNSVATGGEFGDSQTINVNCPPGFDCNNPIDAVMGIQTAPYPNAWYVFVPDTSGQFKISTCDLATCDTEIWMYDYCNMEFFDDTNEATLTWNDDLCGVQAEVTPLLEEGLTYYIRIGDQNSACGSGPLDFLVEFLGGVSGCMDPLACNYLPIAVEPAQCYFDGDIQCPTIGPDLEMLGDVFFNSMFQQTLANSDACYVNEGCMQGFGDREIIRFTTHIKNVGTEDYFIGAPANQPDQFEWDACHNHWHYAGYAEYVLYDGLGNPMPQIGFKNGFCVLDLECSDGGTAKYTCGNMGITAGCGDIYSSGLSCQWIDVTDVPGGEYTLVIRTNWDQSPDANGSYELTYDNNWAAVCVSFDRDVDGNLINFVKTEDCGIIFDCNGVPFGSAVPDCAGNCPGIVSKGDLNNSGELDAADVSQYINDILGNDTFVTPCTDLNNDGGINVTDAAVAAGCVFYGPDHVDEQGVHDHCVWDDQILNPAHNTTFSIGEVNTDLGYVDIHVLNPDNRIVAYDLEVSGITVQSVENLISPVDFDVNPVSTLGGARILGVSLTDQSCPKNLSPVPFVRVYYFSITDVDVCVSLIHDVVNEDYHNVVTTVGGCMPIAGDDFADFSASTTTVCQGSSVDFTDLSTGTNTDWAWSFSGGTPSSSTDQNPAGVVYNVPGVYDVTVTVTNDALQVDSETKVGYITVIASSTWYADTDGDGYGDALNSVVDCSQPAGHVDNDLDCDDGNDAINPDADEVCDGVDNDCNGEIDDNPVDITTWYADMDGDGYGNILLSVDACDQPAGFVLDNTDCDDQNNTMYPGAPGTFIDIDNDCNGVVEEDEVSVGCIGDFNDDLAIDISDLLGFLGAFGCTGDCMPFDINQDAVVNSEDLLLFLPQYGTICD